MPAGYVRLLLYYLGNDHTAVGMSLCHVSLFLWHSETKHNPDTVVGCSVTGLGDHWPCQQP